MNAGTSGGAVVMAELGVAGGAARPVVAGVVLSAGKVIENASRVAGTVIAPVARENSRHSSLLVDPAGKQCPGRQYTRMLRRVLRLPPFFDALDSRSSGWRKQVSRPAPGGWRE